MLKRFIDDWKFRFVIIVLGWSCWWFLAVIKTFLDTAHLGTEILVNTILDFGLVGIIWIGATHLVIFFSQVIKPNGRLARTIGLHVLACLIILVVRTLCFTWVNITVYDENLAFVDNWLKIIPLQLLGNFLIYGLIVASYYAIVWYVEFKDSELKSLKLNLLSEQLERQLSEANLTALRMQLNPHFLFNTLHSVASLIRMKRNEDAINTLSTLSDLLRTTVYDGSDNEVTIGEEIEFVKKYLGIEQLRFSHRLRVVWDIDSSLVHHKIPRLILQPLVENALKHGLKETKGGVLSIVINKTSDDRIALLVTDNGVGLPEQFNLNNTSGVGLKNTIERLHATYNSASTFIISNSRGGAGVQVEIVLPPVLGGTA